MRVEFVQLNAATEMRAVADFYQAVADEEGIASEHLPSWQTDSIVSTRTIGKSRRFGLGLAIVKPIKSLLMLGTT